MSFPRKVMLAVGNSQTDDGVHGGHDHDVDVDDSTMFRKMLQEMLGSSPI